ncbi:HIRA-interacting protein 3 [Dasypus novemcinctus]|uniref:HIRA-interacting protein 3 n=1 Tax=Dasypus novemcinctus TaxID=9361 RepID=UPI0003CBF8F0|nr:HIRA-interacting protein 3 isoform X2 [Dasypus novemcinctus]
MARESEMQEFTRSLFRGRPDLSTLTHSIVRRRFLAHAGRDHLEPEEKQALKRLVEEELLKMQVDEAGTREEKLDLRKKAKRPSTPCSDPESKRFRFNSESEPSSTASSPECFGSPAKTRMAAADVSPPGEQRPKQASKKAIEESSEEEKQQRDLTAQTGSEEVVKDSSEEQEGSARKSKVWKEKSSEEEEEDEGEEESKGRSRKKAVAKNKQALGKASGNRKQAREENEDCEETPSQRAGKKGEGKQATKSHQKSESEEEETLAKKKENREEEEEAWKPRARSNGRKRPVQEERSCKQRSRVGRLMGDCGAEKKKEATNSGDESEEDEKPLVWRKSKVGAQCKAGERQSGSSEEDGDDGCKVGKPIAEEGTRKTAKVGSVNREDSDLEREVSDSEAGESPKEERKSRSSKKSSKKGRTRSSSSSSSDGSPEPKGGKADAGRRGEDHPAVMRLKRYIRACGAHRNYKKLLGSCHSHKERLSVLRAELEALGMKGNPSLEKCRVLKEQREEAAEVASLDIANIISSSGRPRRRTAWNPSREAAPPGELYRRTLDSEEELPHPPPPDWSHMRGIISSDGDSN